MKLNDIFDNPPPYFDSFLGFNGNRWAVIYKRPDNKYYVEENNSEFFPEIWCELPKIEE